LLRGYRDNEPPELRFSTSELIKFRGFGCEQHYADTRDGFILSLSRIVHAPKALPQPAVAGATPADYWMATDKVLFCNLEFSWCLSVFRAGAGTRAARFQSSDHRLAC
jgi:hypothetical protein